MTGKATVRAYGASDPFRYGRPTTDTDVRQAIDRLKDVVEELGSSVVFDTLEITIEYNIGEMTEHVLATVEVEA